MGNHADGRATAARRGERRARDDRVRRTAARCSTYGRRWLLCTRRRTRLRTHLARQHPTNKKVLDAGDTISDMPSASTAELMQGWGAVAGAVFSAVAAIAALLLYRHEVKYRRGERREAQAAQARLITLHLEIEQVEAGSMTIVRCTCTNHSSQPIVNARMAVSRAGQPMPTQQYRNRHLTAPGDHWDELWNTGAATWRPTTESIELIDVEAHLEFVDAAGHRWQRTGQDHPRLLRA